MNFAFRAFTRLPAARPYSMAKFYKTTSKPAILARHFSALQIAASVKLSTSFLHTLSLTHTRLALGDTNIDASAVEADDDET
mmetsp:Transcript_18941/g.34268  ORF Transcript_18941/g.34268 Transcript_18941/m.34268 type:complete len:82 (+) Transcript_18941:336-581(+)